MATMTEGTYEICRTLTLSTAHVCFRFALSGEFAPGWSATNPRHRRLGGN